MYAAIVVASQHDRNNRAPLLSVGRYVLHDEIAQGGMASVHLGRMSSVGGFGRTVAIKRMHRNIATDPEFLAMFLDEARITSRIEHPNVVATLDIVSEAGELFIVMEYVRGESLHRLLRACAANGELVSTPIAVSIMCSALSGLHAAHEATGEDGLALGIVHRDVSPQNILVGEDGIPRILDFGIAKAESRLQTTREGQVKGKLSYMAPEQMSRNQSLDRRIDIFTAATVLWEMLAGKRLFEGDHPGETIARLLTAPIPSLRSLRNDVPFRLDELVQRALSRDPENRPQTAEEFSVLLENAIDGSLASSRHVGAWVARLAGATLESRHRLVREIENSSSLNLTPYSEFFNGSEQSLRKSPAEPSSEKAPELGPPSIPPLPFVNSPTGQALPARWIGPPTDPRMHDVVVAKRPLPWFLMILAFGLLAGVVALLVTESRQAKNTRPLEPAYSVITYLEEPDAASAVPSAEPNAPGRSILGTKVPSTKQPSKRLPDRLSP